MLITNEQRHIANQLNKMETFSKLRPPDAVRIKVKLIEKEFESCNQSACVKQVKKFCVDPMVTSYDILFNLICQAFSIRDEVQLSYLNRQVYSPEVSVSSSTDTETRNDIYMALYNDWDLDAAFLNASHPYLSLRVELKKPDHTDDVYDEWEVIHSTESALTSNQLKRIRLDNSNEKKNPVPNGLNRSFISSAADRAVSVLNRMFSFNRSLSAPVASSTDEDEINLFDLSVMEQCVKVRPPLAESELRNFMDCDGRIVQPQELRQRIFEGGCEPSRRPLLWPILLDIFPSQHMTSQQRADFTNLKSIEYKNLKHSLWYNSNKLLHQNSSQIVSDSSFDSNFSDEQQLNNLAHKIYKDVWRTDRNHKFYSGESNKNTEALFNILMTYTLSNRGQPYCQGMSDLLSPLLYVLKDESLAYYCFCALMTRCSQNFEITSDSITTKIRLLAALIQKFDPQLWTCLHQAGAEQLLFVYRWLLIECKREFPFADSLRVFEIMFSSIPSHKSIGILKEPAVDLNMSQNSLNNNNNNCSSCKICEDKNDVDTEIETDTDIESVNGFNYYNHLRRNKERRRRRLSLNTSFYSHKSKTKFKPSSLNTNCYLTELREQQYEEKKLKKSRRGLNRPKRRSKSVERVGPKENLVKRSSSEANLRTSYDHMAKKVPVLFAKQLKSSLLGNSAERKHRPSSTSSDLSDDLNKLKIMKAKKKVKIVNSSPRNDIEEKAKKKILFKNIKKSLEKSHLRINKKFTKYHQTHKSSTSSKSSTSAYVSAGSVLSSASSSMSSCSNTYSKPKCSNGSMPIRIGKDQCHSNSVLGDEELVHQLSKLDNPFLLFVCFAIFLENREFIISSQMDANDIACYFDKMTRKHNAKNVLIRARYLYTKLYLAKVNAFSYIQQLMDIQNSP